jgi:hypothetical protein
MSNMEPGPRGWRHQARGEEERERGRRWRWRNARERRRAGVTGGGGGGRLGLLEEAGAVAVAHGGSSRARR